MSISYTWTIENMTTQKQLESYTDVVIQVAWKCVGTDGTYYSVVPGLSRITFSDGSTFTPYADLTEEQVLNWLWSSDVNKNSVETKIDYQIELQVNPPTVILPLPWTT